MKSVKFELDIQNQVASISKNTVLDQISTKVYSQAIKQFVDQIDEQIWYDLWDQIGDDLDEIS
jgi:hypothetical protein